MNPVGRLQDKPSRRLHFWREWLSPALFALLLTQFGATAVRVDGVSMMPGLRHGEMVAVPKLEGWAHRLGLGQYARGDVVVFKPPRVAADEWKRDWQGVPVPWAYRPYLIKRVIGVAGDRVRIRQGQVSVNGRALDQTWTQDFWRQEGCLDTASTEANSVQTGFVPGVQQAAEVTVPAHTVFVMGDNRSPGGSLDSRFFGPVDLNDVAGRAALSLWPILRQEQVAVPCRSADAKHQVSTSGPETWNWRALLPPAAFEMLDAK